MNNILKIENLNTSYGQNLVLKDINLEIKEGSIFGLIGPNRRALINTNMYNKKARALTPAYKPFI